MGTLRAPHSAEMDEAVAGFHAQHGYSPMPLLVEWMATGACTLRCPHCYSAPEANAARGPDLTTREVALLLDQLVELGVPDLLISGGEPLTRQDFCLIVELLAARKLRYSLNTAAYPSAGAVEKMQRWPPHFVAVSLDGPSAQHDAFRGRAGAHTECMRAIALYRELTQDNVAVGTTVTRHNLRHLEATFLDVVRSGACRWGLHLVLPEGRAAHRADLRLLPQQARCLLDFCTTHRRHFPVTLCDEIGYVGEWEPLVRDAPLRCSAGRTQCVVLPDGAVAPCTTLDPRAAVGSLRERSLAELWHEGRWQVRQEALPGECQNCSYVAVCGGGCWLLRRRGNVHCYRHVWSRKGTFRQTAATAVCLGLAACAKSAPPEPHPTAPPPRPTVVTATAASVELDRSLARCLLATSAVNSADGEALGQLLENDPAREQIWRLLQRPRSAALDERVARLRDVLETKSGSLHLVSLLYRDLADWSLECQTPEERTLEQRALLGGALDELARRTDDWRIAIAEQRLGRFLDDREVLTAALTSRVCKGANSVSVSVSVPDPAHAAFKHWDLLPTPGQRARLTRAYLARHPFANNLSLRVRAPVDSGARRVSKGRALALHSGPIGVFDRVRTPAGLPLRVTITYGSRALYVDSGGLPLGGCVHWDSETQRRLEEQLRVDVRTSAGRSVEVELPPAVELGYVDLLRIAYSQQREELDTEPGSPFHLIDAWEQYERTSDDPQAEPSEVDSARRRLLVAWLL